MVDDGGSARRSAMACNGAMNMRDSGAWGNQGWNLCTIHI